MAVIERADGQVIAWGGEVDGPHPVYDDHGERRALDSYSAKLGVGDSELHEVVVYVSEQTKMVLGRSSPQREELVKQCVARYIKNHCQTRWVPGLKEHFTVSDDEMLQLRQSS
jgi:hypothetical protein